VFADRLGSVPARKPIEVSPGLAAREPAHIRRMQQAGFVPGSGPNPESIVAGTGAYVT
jgi:hypothetical protein